MHKRTIKFEFRLLFVWSVSIYEEYFESKAKRRVEAQATSSAAAEAIAATVAASAAPKKN